MQNQIRNNILIQESKNFNRLKTLIINKILNYIRPTKLDTSLANWLILILKKKTLEDSKPKSSKWFPGKFFIKKNSKKLKNLAWIVWSNPYQR